MNQVHMNLHGRVPLSHHSPSPPFRSLVLTFGALLAQAPVTNNDIKSQDLIHLSNELPAVFADWATDQDSGFLQRHGGLHPFEVLKALRVTRQKQVPLNEERHQLLLCVAGMILSG